MTPGEFKPLFFPGVTVIETISACSYVKVEQNRDPGKQILKIRKAEQLFLLKKKTVHI